MNPRACRALPAVLVLAAALLVGCSGGKNAVDQGAGQRWKYPGPNKKGTVTLLANRKLAGPVTGNLIGGGSYQLSQDRGKVVVLNFFASWCPPCQTETPQFDSIYRAHKADGVQFVGLDVKDPSKSGAQAWLQNKNITFPVVYDEPAKTALQLGNVPLVALPATVLIDRQGRVAAVYTQEVFPADLEPVLNQLIHETA